MARSKWRLPRFFDRKSLPRKASHAPQHKVLFEALEPRILLSADFMTGATGALAGGLDQFDERLDGFLDAEDLFATQLPFIVQVQQVEGGQEQVAPTLGSLFSVQVDTNGAEQAGGIDTVLDGLDKQGDPARPGYADGIVDAGEFVQGWLFGQIHEELDAFSNVTSYDDSTVFIDWLEDLNVTRTVAQVGSPGVTIRLDVISATDLTEAAPNADLVFDVDFKLTVSQNLAIDLGTEADAIKLLYFTGDYEHKVSPVIPVDAELAFGFTFGVRTGGQESPGEALNDGDFFVRSADDLYISAKTNDPDDDTTDIEGVAFHLNIGFLGAEVTGGTIDFQAAVSTLLVDPDSPEVLGFTTAQYGVEQSSGVVTGFDAIPSEDLSHDAGFVLCIGNAGIATEVKVLADNNDDMAGLLVDVNAALTSAGLGNLVEASINAENHLVFTLVETTDTPFGFANESYSDTGVLSANPGGFEFASAISLLLSVDGALPKLVTVNFPDTAQTELHFDDTQNATLPSLIGQNPPNASGTLSEMYQVEILLGDPPTPFIITLNDITANFTLRITQSDGSLIDVDFAVAVTESLAGPDPNTLVSQLVNDIDQALANAGVGGLVDAYTSDGKIVLDPAPQVSAIMILPTDPAEHPVTQNDIGFVAELQSTLTLTALAPLTSFDLSADAHLRLAINTSGEGSATVDVTIAAGSYGNASVLAAAIDDAIDQALVAEGFGNKIDATVDASGRLVLQATNSSVLSFSISTVNQTIDDLVDDVNRALAAAGLAGVVEASAVDADTLQLATTDGQSLEISKTLTLDAGVTTAELQEPPAVGGTATEDLFAPTIDEDHSNIQFNLPVGITAGLNYTPPNVTMVGNFSPFGERLVTPQADPPRPVATIGDGDTRFALNFTYTPTIDNQDEPVEAGDVPASSELTEQICLVNMAEPLNFNLITSESMIGLIMGLGTALQQIADSGLFAGYDIPFADASLSDLLNVSDSSKYVFSGLIDRLLIYDTNGTGIYDPSVTGSVADDADRLLKWVVDDNKTPGDPADDVVYLIPNFVTAQDLAGKLDLLLANMDLAGISANYNPAADPAYPDDPTRGINELTYHIELLGGGRTTVAIDDAPFEYDVDLSPFAKMLLYPSDEPSDLAVKLTGYTGLNMTFGIDLSPPGAVIYGVTDLALLNGGAGVDIKPERAVTGEDSVRAVVTLSAPATFGLEVDGTNYIVHVSALNTSGMGSYDLADLRDHINSAIAATGASGKVVAGIEDGRLTLAATGGTTSFKAHVATVDPAFKELGFYETASPVVKLLALKTAPTIIGRLTGDATFDIDFTDDAHGPYLVTVAAAVTAGNRTISDLVADVNNALVLAGISGRVAADYDATASQGPRLVLTALDSPTTFTLNNANLYAVNELGLSPAVTTANQYDFVIYDRDGGAHPISLDGLPDEPTVQDLIDHINGQIPGGEAIAGFNATRTGLQLFDNTGATDTEFRVETINGSGALLTLGLMLESVDDLIAGGPIGETHLDDRFFVREAELLVGIGLTTPNPPGELGLATPGVVGSALFGIVGVDTYLSGSLYAEFVAGIKDPATGTVGGTATLLELFEGAKQGRLTTDATFQVTVDGATYDLTVYKAWTEDDPVSLQIDETNDTLADLVADVNKAIVAAGLAGKIAARVSGTRIEFVALDDPATSSINEAETLSFTIAPNGTGAAELGLELEAGMLWLASSPVEGVQTFAAHSATRFAVADVAVSAADELYVLPIANLQDFNGQFGVGRILYGWDTTPDPDVQTADSAVVVGIEYDDATLTGRLILSHVSGTFADAEIVFQDYGQNGATKAGSLTQRTSFGEFVLHVDVQPEFGTITEADPPVPTGFGDGFAPLDGLSRDVRFNITDVGNPYDPAPPEATFVDLPGDTGDLYAFKDLDYADIGTAVHDLLNLLVEINTDFDLLNLKLPAINKSVSDLLSLVDGFERGVANLDEIFAAAIAALDPEQVDIPALTLQAIPNALRGAFGLPEGINPDDTNAVDWVKFDFDKTNNMLLVNLNLHETIDTKLGLDIEVDETLPNITSGGVLKVNGTLDVNLNIGIDLTAPNNAYLFDTSNIAADLHVEGEGQNYETSSGETSDGMGLVFRAAIGPLAVFIQDGDALIDVAFALGLNFGEGIHRKLISEVTFDPDNTEEPDDFLDPVISKNSAAIVLPMFYGGEGPDNYLGDFSADGNLVDPTTLEKGTLDVVVPDFSGVKADIESGAVAYDPFENILLGIDTLNFYLEGLSDTLAGDVLGIQLPFIGDQMADILFIENFRSSLYSILKNGVANAIAPDPTLITDKLYEALAGYLNSDDTKGYVGVNYEFDLSSPEIINWFHQWNFTLTDSETIFLTDFDLGIPGLGFDVDTPVQVEFAWTLDIGFGVNFVEGAYIDISDIKEQELDLNLTITLPGGTPMGMLGFLLLQVSDNGDETGAILDFEVNVEEFGDPTSAHLGFSDLGKINPVATVQGTPYQGDHALSLHLATEANYGLPALAADLVIDWSLLAGTKVNDLNGDAVTTGIEFIALYDMNFDSGSVARSMLGPVFEEIMARIEPFMPVIDVLTAPIPVLSDLAGEPFTILDLAAIFGSVDSEFIDAVADILDVISIIGDSMATNILPLGDLVLYDPDNGILYFDPSSPDASLAEIDLAALTPAAGDDGLTVPMGGAEGDFDYTDPGNEFLKLVRSDPPVVKGLTMPIFTDPLQAIGLFLDQNAVMIDYQLPPLAVEFEYLQVFPIWGPLAVSIEISFGFTVDLHSIGFDTYGYQRYADGGFRNPWVMLDGFYLNDLNAEGVDAPEILFEFGLVGAAELNLGIARAGVGGGINAQIYFDWYDPIADGRVHISELYGNVISADPGPNPLAVFDVGGALTFQLFAFLEISLLGIEEEFPITPETELFSFEETFAHNPIMATKIEGTNILQLNIGPNSEDRIYGDISDGHESVTVNWISGDTVEVGGTEYSGIGHIIGVGGQGNDAITLNLGTSAITYELDGGLGDDTITVNDGTLGGSIIGGVGNDTLQGGGGNDQIYGGEGNDVIGGGGGHDIIFGDQGRVVDNDYVAKPYITSRVTLADGADRLSGEDGDDVILGAGGDDLIDGGTGNDILIGDGGRFEFEWANSEPHVNIASLRPAAYPPAEVYTDDPDTPAQISADIDAVYDALMASFHATDLFYGGNDEIHGGENDDMMFGGSGNDILEGDAGNDLILGGKGFDEIYGGTRGSAIPISETVTDQDTIFGGDQADIISGNEDDDVISGGSGNDYIHGNDGDDVMKGDSGADVMFGDKNDDQLFGLTEPDILFGGADNDLVVGGTSNDIMFGDDGLVAKLDPADGSGVKVIYNGLLISEAVKDALLADVIASEGEGAFYDDDIRTLDLILTYVTTDDGDDIMSGEAADDIMLGGGGNDLMGGDVDPRLPNANINGPTDISEDVLIGDGGMITFDQRRFRSIATVIEPSVAGEFDDTIYGDNGNDYIFGGWGNDFLFGGHGKVVTAGVVGASRGATDVDASDNDIIVGDNGEILFADETIADNFGIKELIRTTDEANDTGGHDYAEGELGNDVIFGGVNGSVDVLIGNAGSDVILGDNGELDFAYGTDTNLDTLDLIRSYRDGLGGTDIVSGKEEGDVLIGGTGGDEMYGDDATASSGAADGEDIMLGDNADIFLLGTVGRLTVQVAEMTTGTAVDLITTTDAIDDDHTTKADAEACGGPDTMAGNAGNDIMFGGVNNDDGILLFPVNLVEKDVMYGDRAVPDATTIANDGDDILLGDNGLLDFTYDPADYPGDDQSVIPDTDRNTLDLIHSEEDSLGGIDIISGNKGMDVAIGGTGGDFIYGDDSSASAAGVDEGDLLLGDNSDIFLAAAPTSGDGFDLKTVLDAAIYLIRTTDTLDPASTGGADTISGNARGDIIAGGVSGDTLYGDRSAPNATTEGDEGDDIILGDNGAFEWLSIGRLSEINSAGAYIDIGVNNPALWAKYGTNSADSDLTTLDLVTTEQPTSGGRDLIYGDRGRDFVFGGTDSDEIYGDDGNLDEEPDSANNDLLFGDHGRIYPQFSMLRAPGQDWRLAFNSRNFFAIDVGDSGLLISDGGEGDRMWGEEGDDTMLGQQGDDRMWGGSGDDDMTGGHNVAGGYDELTAPAIDAVLGLTAPPVNDLMDGGSGDDSMAGDNAIIWRRGDNLSPRFRELTAESIYTTTADTIAANIGGTWQSDPAEAVGRDIQLIDHSDAVQTTPAGRFGNDVMAGGADSDTMFGELGNDLMQGDGSIESVAVAAPFISRELTVTDTGSPDTGEKLYFNIPEQASDADDYLEGNGGSDLMYGGLGQDDMLGGSSALFGLTDETMRPDTTDYIYGGAGIATARNDIGATETEALASLDDTTEDGDPADMVITTAANGHARDADYIMGDNANVYRLTGTEDYDGDGTATYSFLQFNYDNYGSLKIIPRAMRQLDYTLGGADYAGGDYANGIANADNGAADLIHGESGDDVIFGMTGSDVIFGEGQDDDIVGGYGHDWISGGTGQDGILGDDGLIRTSRNSTAGEPLNGVAGLLDRDPRPKYADGNVLDEVIATPGSIQYAVINLSGELKKTVDLVPFSYDPEWAAMDDEFPDNQDASPYADDIIFGGLGTDWLHGGSGDDAISGAEALEAAFVPVYDSDGAPTDILDLGYAAVDLNPETIEPGITAVMAVPGDVLAFNKTDSDGQHLNNRYRAGEFDLYDEYDPRRTILLTPDGELYQETGGTDGVDYFQFLLNFDESEGVVRGAGTVPKATGQQTESYPVVNDDGKDAIFGDLGNDWLVGGTGRDNLYGGWGNDLLNADDDHDGHANSNELNNFTDTHPYYEDRAYGGAGRDVLIGNTGGDRLIDWVGEYNSYLVPYAPFGQASVSRTLQPFLPEFLYSLSAGDGADPTRYNDTGAETLRNGEPDAEMGLVLQKDFAWQNQTGAPADPQAGNIPGGARDVLRSANFQDGTTQGFVADSGKWSLQSGVFYVEPTVLGTDAVSVWYHDQVVPSYFELTATVNPVKPLAGYKANAYIVFDYYGPNDFKFAGLNSSTNKIEIGQRTASGWQVLTSVNMLVKAGTSYNLLLALNGTTATIMVNNKLSVSFAFAPRVDIYGMTHNFNDGMIGLGSDNAKASIDNVSLRVLPPAITLSRSEDFSTAPTLLSGETGTWSLAKGYYVGAPAAGQTLALAGGDLTVGPAYLLQLEAKIATNATGGIVFDRYAVDDFKWVAYAKSTNRILLGHYTAQDGWVVDKAVSRTLSGDVTLSVTLKGTTVSVLVNGSAAMSYVYNAVVTDGGYGLLAKGGSASFDSFTIKSDDPALAQAPPAAALAAAQPAPADAHAGDAVTETVLGELAAAAKSYWRKALGEEAVAALDGITVEAAELNGLLLGQIVGNTIQIDLNAAGYGWFVDETPEDSVEFLRRGGRGQGVGHDTFLATKQSDAAGHIDLLTVLTHEMGHLLGFDHDASWSVMDADLDAGVRILPKQAATVDAPGKTISMAAREVLAFDEGQGVFHDLLQGSLRKWTDGRAAERGGSSLADRQRGDDPFRLFDV